MKIGIVGTGAMGCVYAALFGDAGNEVWAVDSWAEHVAAMAENGLTLEGASGTRTVRLNATTDPAAAGPCDLVIIATKAMDVVAAAEAARAMLAPDGFIEGSPEGSGRFEASVQVTDSAGRTATAATAFIVREYRFIRARGGSVTVVVTGDSVGFFSALHGEGFVSTQVLRSGPIVVEVAFLPISGDEASWVRCEVANGVSCTHD